MPHFGNSYSVEARQLLWKGNSVRNAVKVQSLSEEIAQLSYTTNEQAIQLLVLGYYLDLYKLRNQAQVYEKNINLAHQRLTNIQRFEKQGMVTRNDVIRGELQVSNLKLALQVVQNNQQILNHQLVLALGLPIGTVIVPTEKVLPESQLLAEEQFQQQAKQHPTLQIAQRGVELRKTATKITRASFMPSLSAFAGNTVLIDIDDLVDKKWLMPAEARIADVSAGSFVDFERVENLQRKQKATTKPLGAN